MATRSLIGTWDRATGSVRMIYCHSDGYIEWVGVRLARSYSTSTRVRKLLALGALYSLGDYLSFEDRRRVPFTEEELAMMSRLGVYPAAAHSYSNPLSEVTVAFHRDRDDQLDRAFRLRMSRGDILDAADDARAEFVYLYDGSTWLVAADSALSMVRLMDTPIEAAFVDLKTRLPADQAVEATEMPATDETRVPVVDPGVCWWF